MKKSEIKKLTYTIRLIYPWFYLDMSDYERNMIDSAWMHTLKDYEYKLANAALIICLKNDKVGCPPSPGKVKATIEELIEKGEEA